MRQVGIIPLGRISIIEANVEQIRTNTFFVLQLQNVRQSVVCGRLKALWSPWIGISAPYPCTTRPSPNPSSHAFPPTTTDCVVSVYGGKNKKYLTVTRRKRVLLAWLEAHEHRQDPGENGRRIEHFIGENEHLY